MEAFLSKALLAIPSVATSPPALAAYIIVIVAWGVITWRVARNKRLLAVLEKLPEADRLKALEAEMGNVPIRSGITADHWLRSRVHLYYFLAFSITCLTLLLLFLLGGYTEHSKGLTPSRMASEEYRREVRESPSEMRGEVVRKAAKLLFAAFDRKNYSDAEKVIDFLKSIDPKNGHALYFAGEVKRSENMRDQSHKHYYRYLDVEATLPESEKGGSIEAELCYQRAGGYCRQRTAWIRHQLANDFYKDGLRQEDKNKKRESFLSAREYVMGSRKDYPKGFIQLVPTSDLERNLDSELAALNK